MDDLPLFNAGPEREGPYRVLTLIAAGHSQRGDWLQVWADAKHALHSLQDRSAVLRELGFDPEKYEQCRPAPITKKPNGSTRTWWYCWPLDTPKPWLQDSQQPPEEPCN